jgi:O-antigen ligase
MPGVAKIIFDGKRYIRAYGTFPHPNIFAGFLSLSVFLTYFGLSKPKYALVSAKNKWLILAIIIQAVALILTFSKSAILGMILGITLVNYAKIKNVLSNSIVPRGTIENTQAENNVPRGTIPLLSKLTLGIALLMLLLLVFSKLDNGALIAQPLTERLTLLNVSRGTIQRNALLGVGMGQFVINMPNYSQEILLDWQLQPVHNTPLLILSELGIIGLALFAFIIYTFINNTNVSQPIVPRGTKVYENIRGTEIVPRGTYLDLKTSRILKMALISQIPPLLLDHYHWDIQQGQLIMCFLVILVLQSNKSVEHQT